MSGSSSPAAGYGGPVPDGGFAISWLISWPRIC